jgi:hypothetical protein
MIYNNILRTIITFINNTYCGLFNINNDEGNENNTIFIHNDLPQRRKSKIKNKSLKVKPIITPNNIFLNSDKTSFY